MNITEYALKKQTVSWMFVVLLFFGGWLSFNGLGRLEDPEFTLKNAIIITQYPGASSLEVEEEITLPIENAIQQLAYVDKVTSISAAGLSQVEVEMKSQYRAQELAQIWDEMRRKISDMQNQFPPGAKTPIINDDFSDVFGVFYAVTGEDYSYDEISNYTDFLLRELVLVEGVGKVNVGGKLREQIYIEVDRAKLAASGLYIDSIKALLAGQSLVSDAGSIEVADDYLRISSEMSAINDLDELAGLLLSSKNGKLVYLSDVATLSHGYQDPATHVYRHNGQRALTLGVSFSENVNVVKVGNAIKKRLSELEYARPFGMKLDAIYNQPQQVRTSVNDFLVGLAQAIAIVIIVLMITMGWRPGLIMSSTLLLTIAGTFIVMNLYRINLHRISLGALIIALGMLVDNAIVITEGIIISVQRGMSKIEASIRIVSHTRWPLCGATIIAITAFAPIGLSPDSSGEFTGSLFWVLLISLSLSWVLAITLTPFFCTLLFKQDDKTIPPSNKERSSYNGFAYSAYQGILMRCLAWRWTTVLVMLALLISATVAFGRVKQAFFPDSSLPIYFVDYWLPEGSSIHSTEKDISGIEKYLLTLPEVENVTSSIGRGAERFMLTYAPEKNYASYGQLIVRAKSYSQVKHALEKTRKYIYQHYPQAFARYKQSTVGPSTAAKIEARVSGPDADVLRRIGRDLIAVFRAQHGATNIRQDWRERTKILTPFVDSASAKRLGITQADIDAAIITSLSGQQVGLFRQGSKILPVIIRLPEEQRQGSHQLEKIEVYSPVTNRYINSGEFIQRIDVKWEDPIIKRVDRKRTLSVLADPNSTTTTFTLQEELSQAIKTIEIPPGYNIQWGGEYEAQQQANTSVFKFVPLGLLVMIAINILMFNSIKQTLVIWLTVPLAIIGVAYGLLLSNAPFSFTALLAVLSLIGMQIKNGIVLVEEIKRLYEEEGLEWIQAIGDASVSRLRPVSMAAVTTILGMIPLLGDVFFRPMAITIMAGLGFATILTLIVVPVLFALFYRVQTAGTRSESAGK